MTATSNPGVNDDADDGYSYLSFWRNTSNSNFYICVNPTVGSAVWTILSDSTDIVNTFNGRTGTVTPAINDYDASLIEFDPAGENFASASDTVRKALIELMDFSGKGEGYNTSCTTYLGISSSATLISAIGTLANEIIALDATIESGIDGISKTIVADEYNEKSVTVADDTTVILTTCANLGGYKTLSFNFAGKTTQDGSVGLYIDGVMKSNLAIQGTDYTDYVGTYSVSGLDSNVKIELKLTDDVGSGTPALYSKLHTVELSE